MARIEILDKALVDEKLWYTLICDREVTSWIRTIDANHNYYKIVGGTVGGTLIDMREDIYMFAMIRWS
jgi:hypothetical protein